MDIVVGNFKATPFNELCWDIQKWKAARPHHANGGLGGEPKWRSCGCYPSVLSDALNEVARAMHTAQRQSAALKRALTGAQRIERRLELAATSTPAKKGVSIEYGDYRIVCNNELYWEIQEWKAAAPHHSNRGVAGEPKWVSTGKFPSLFSQALGDVYELTIKREEGEFDAVEAIKRAEKIADGLLSASGQFIEESKKDQVESK